MEMFTTDEEKREIEPKEQEIKEETKDEQIKEKEEEEKKEEVQIEQEEKEDEENEENEENEVNEEEEEEEEDKDVVDKEEEEEEEDKDVVDEEEEEEEDKDVVDEEEEEDITEYDDDCNDKTPFSKLELHESILFSLYAQKYIFCANIQKKTIPHILKRKNVLLHSETGSGKTLCFVIPILQRLMLLKRLDSKCTNVKVIKDKSDISKNKNIKKEKERKERKEKLEKSNKSKKTKKKEEDIQTTNVESFDKNSIQRIYDYFEKINVDSCEMKVVKRINIKDFIVYHKNMSEGLEGLEGLEGSVKECIKECVDEKMEMEKYKQLELDNKLHEEEKNKKRESTKDENMSKKLKKDIKRDIKKDLKEDIKKDLKENIKKDLKEDIKKDLKEDIKRDQKQNQVKKKEKVEIKMTLQNKKSNKLQNKKSNKLKSKLFCKKFKNETDEQIRVYSIIITPTRELCIQIYALINRMIFFMRYYLSHMFYEKLGYIERYQFFINVMLYIGTVKIEKDIKKIKKEKKKKNRYNILVSTPGKLCRLLTTYKEYFNLSNTKYLILDEGDKLLENTFLHYINDAIKNLYNTYCTCICSATCLQEEQFYNLFSNKKKEYIKCINRKNMSIQNFQMPQQLKNYYIVVRNLEKQLFLFKFLNTVVKKNETVVIFFSTCFCVDFFFHIFQILFYSENEKEQKEKIKGTKEMEKTEEIKKTEDIEEIEETKEKDEIEEIEEIEETKEKDEIEEIEEIEKTKEKEEIAETILINKIVKIHRKYKIYENEEEYLLPLIKMVLYMKKYMGNNNFHFLKIHRRLKGKERNDAFINILNKKDDKKKVILCTDVMSRGVNINVQWVVNYDVANRNMTYVHRSGRTSRFNETGKTLILLNKKEEEYIFFLKNKKVHIQNFKHTSMYKELIQREKTLLQNQEQVKEKLNQQLLEIVKQQKLMIFDVKEKIKSLYLNEQIYSKTNINKKQKQKQKQKNIQPNSNLNIILQQHMVESFLKIVSFLVVEYRELYLLAKKAFLSYVEFYKNHQLSFIFQLKKLNLSHLCFNFGLVRVPKFKDGLKVEGYKSLNVNTDNITYRDKEKEKQRKEAMRIAQTMTKKQKNKENKKQRKNGKTGNGKGKGKENENDGAGGEDSDDIGFYNNKEKNRRQRIERKIQKEEQELEYLSWEENLYKKLKKRKISQKEYDALLGMDRIEKMLSSNDNLSKRINIFKNKPIQNKGPVTVKKTRPSKRVKHFIHKMKKRKNIKNKRKR